jgi:hypothetical protein
MMSYGLLGSGASTKNEPPYNFTHFELFKDRIQMIWP